MNTETVKTCPKCNAPIPPEAPQGLCPKCLLASASIPTEAGQATEGGPPPSLETIAAGFPQLEILEFIGQGGMGLVFKARQPKLDRFVALKLLPQKPGADPAFCERFNREARVLARLSHPNIVAVHDFGEAGPFFYLLMEYVDGVNLRQAMRAGRFTPAQALALVPKICDALQYAHEEGVLHRDIKPENLLLDARGRVKIADFGIAKLLGDPKDITLTARGSAIGTPHYMAPEQLERPQDVDQRADVYSLGVVFYELLTGELPIGRFAPPSEKAAMDPRVDQVVLRTLEKERDRRFQSAGDVKTQVEKITASPTTSQPGPSGTVNLAGTRQLPPSAAPAMASASPVSRMHRLLRALASAALAGVSLFVVVLFLRIRGGPGALLLGAIAVVAILSFNALLLRRLFWPGSSQRTLLPMEVQAFLRRFSRRTLWLFGSALAVFLLLVLSISHRHRMEMPETVPPVQPPNAPFGFDVAPGDQPGNDRLYRSVVTVPPGYALTLATVLCSNQVVLKPGLTNGVAVLMAPRGQPVQAQLSWRLLGNTTFADGAPLQISLNVAGPESGDKSFQVVPPEPVSVDWAAEPPRLWPPENGRTKFLLIKGLAANPGAPGEPATEWALGIEARVDPISENVLRDLKSPVVTLGTNLFSVIEDALAPESRLREHTGSTNTQSGI
jgi:tRNA A-37 threonylcarbamoyl transferase component Bud32